VRPLRFLAGIVLLALSGTVLSQDAKPLTNADIIALVKVGIGVEVIKAKIGASPHEFDTSAQGLAQLKAAGVPDELVVAMLGAGSAGARPRSSRVVDQLSADYRRLQNAVVTVWSETGHGTGFILDRGLIVTNQHVVGPSEYIAVQFDASRKIPARMLEADPGKDVAVLWADVAAFPEAIAVTISGSKPTVEEGEKVFTIGSPLSQRKILTTGIASKVEERAIISDININPGNSGGPLFNSLGEVVGITTFSERTGQSGPGISGIVRIEEALPLLEKARAHTAAGMPPEGVLLPVESASRFPVDAIKTASGASKGPEWSAYVFGIHDYDIGIVTPPLMFRQSESERQAVESHKKRSKASNTEAFNPAANLHNWAEYAGGYQAVVTVRATPKLRETFWSGLGRGLAAASGAGYVGPANMKFKSDFRRMDLLCGSEVVTPIQPGRIAHVIDVRNPFVRATDATYEGIYSYPSEAFAPECGQVTLKVYPVKASEAPIVKVLDRKTVDRVWADFEAWRTSQ
jgi:S1-C subfamily serine protease